MGSLVWGHVSSLIGNPILIHDGFLGAVTQLPPWLYIGWDRELTTSYLARMILEMNAASVSFACHAHSKHHEHHLAQCPYGADRAFPILFVAELGFQVFRV